MLKNNSLWLCALLSRPTGPTILPEQVGAPRLQAALPSLWFSRVSPGTSAQALSFEIWVEVVMPLQGSAGHSPTLTGSSLSSSWGSLGTQPKCGGNHKGDGAKMSQVWKAPPPSLQSPIVWDNSLWLLSRWLTHSPYQSPSNHTLSVCSFLDRLSFFSIRIGCRISKSLTSVLCFLSS